MNRRRCTFGRCLHIVNHPSVGAVLILLFWAPAHAASELPSTVADELQAAATETYVSHLQSAVVSAVAKHPELVSEIVEHAVRLRPARASSIVASATYAFPGFSRTIAEAADSVTGGTRAAQGLEAALGEGKDVSGPEWSGELELGGSISTGNTDRENLNANGKVDYHTGPWRTQAKFTLQFTRDEGRTTADRMVASIEPRYDITDRLFAFNFLQYEDDRFSGFDFQVTENVGLGYWLIKSETLTSSVSAGPGVRLNAIRATNETETEVTGRLATDTSWDISGNVALTLTSAAVLSGERLDTESKIALTTKITQTLAARVSIELRHDTNPPGTAKSTDTLTQFSVLYAF